MKYDCYEMTYKMPVYSNNFIVTVILQKEIFICPYEFIYMWSGEHR